MLKFPPVPCKDCVCLAICRHKRVANLHVDCALFRYYTSNGSRWLRIHDVLQPTQWEVSVGVNGDVSLTELFND